MRLPRDLLEAGGGLRLYWDLMYVDPEQLPPAGILEATAKTVQIGSTDMSTDVKEKRGSGVGAGNRVN